MELGLELPFQIQGFVHEVEAPIVVVIDVFCIRNRIRDGEENEEDKDGNGG